MRDEGRSFPLAGLVEVETHGFDDSLFFVQGNEQYEAEAHGEHDGPLGHCVVEANAAHLVDDVEHECGET